MTLSKKALEIATKEVGTKELPGKQDNPRIIEYEKSCEKLEKLYSDSELSWCSCFVNWCITQAGGIGTNNAMARSWLSWGDKVDKPQAGDIVVFTRGINSISGHVGFITEVGPVLLTVLSGNSNNQVQYAKFSRLRVLGYRRHA